MNSEIKKDEQEVEKEEEIINENKEECEKKEIENGLENEMKDEER